MSDHFKLDSGRSVSIESVSIRSIYENYLEGDPDYISAEIWRRTPGQLEEEFGAGVTILKPLVERLPNYRFVVVLRSRPLPSTIPEDYSYMTICWFQTGLNGSLVEMVQEAVRALQWEKHAKNCSV